MRTAEDSRRPGGGQLRRRRCRVDDRLSALGRALADCQRDHAMTVRQRDALTGSGAGVVHGVGLKLASFGSSRNDVLV